MSSPGKLVLCVIDAMAPAMLERAVAEGVAPVLAALMARGSYVNDCVAAFPSVTPVCAASIVTGAAQDEHHIPGMNWFHREEERYVEYGSSFRAGQRFGITRQLTDLVYNMNRAHLSQQTPTVFETLDDAGQRTAGTTYLMYRGRHRHEPQRDTTLTRFASRLMRHPVMGPRELFYADIFASRPTGCRSAWACRGCATAIPAASAPTWSSTTCSTFCCCRCRTTTGTPTSTGPRASCARSPRPTCSSPRVFDAGGGIDSFLQEHAVIVMADHSQAPVESAIDLQEELAGLGVLQPEGANLLGALTGTRTQSRTRGGNDQEPHIAVCPSQRAAMVYALNEAERDAMRASVVARALAIEGVDLVAWLSYDAHDRPSEGVVSSPGRGELRFAPGGDLLDARGASWHVDGALGVLNAAVRGGDNALTTPAYPDALARLWPALTCPTSGEVLLSAAPGYEFVDWGGAAHMGGGSHGSLHVSDSLGALVLCGLEGGAARRRPASRGGWDRLLQSDPVEEPAQWAIRDIAPLVLRHFGLTAEGEQPPVGL